MTEIDRYVQSVMNGRDQFARDKQFDKVRIQSIENFGEVELRTLAGTTESNLVTKADSIFVEGKGDVDLLSNVKEQRKLIENSLDDYKKLIELRDKTWENIASKIPEDNADFNNFYAGHYSDPNLSADQKFNIMIDGLDERAKSQFDKVNGMYIPSVFVDEFEISLDDWKKENFEIAKDIKDDIEQNELAIEEIKKLLETAENAQKVKLTKDMVEKSHQINELIDSIGILVVVTEMMNGRYQKGREFFEECKRIMNKLNWNFSQTYNNDVVFPNGETCDLWSDKLVELYEETAKKYIVNKNAKIGGFYYPLLETLSDCKVEPAAYAVAISELTEDKDIYVSEFCNAFELNKEQFMHIVSEKKKDNELKDEKDLTK